MSMNTHSYRWTIVGIGALMTCVALGAMFSLAIFLDPLSRGTGWSRAGVSVAMTISPLARWLITAYDWRTAMLLIGILAWVLLIPAAMFVRQPPVVAADAPASNDVPEGPIGSLAQALRSRQFSVQRLVFFLCCAAHSGPIFHMVSYAMSCGIAPMAAVSIYSVEGLAGLGGRLLLGAAGDKFGGSRGCSSHRSASRLARWQ